MNNILKSKYFFNREELTKFVNDEKIKQNDIQNILVVEEKHFVLYYWEANTLNE